jgi:hypothetical protein
MTINFFLNGKPAVSCVKPSDNLRLLLRSLGCVRCVTATMGEGFAVAIR